MPAGRHSSSSRRPTLAIALTVLGLSGCAGQLALAPALEPPAELRMASAADPAVAPQPAPGTLRLADAGETAATSAAGAVTPKTPPAARLVPASDTSAANDVAITAGIEAQSPWCRYLRENAAADATIMRAPTVNGIVDNSGKAGINLSFSLVGLRKAQLTEQSAEASCRRYLAENAIKKQVFIGQQQLSGAGYAAKASVIAAHHAELERLRARIRRELNDGNLTADRASALRVAIDQIYSDEGQARSQADRRSVYDLSGSQMAGIDKQLLRAEADQQDIDKALRTANAFDISLQAGYSDPNLRNGFDTTPRGFSGQLKFSVALGAFVPSRYAHEEAAKQARLEALNSEDGGPIWQARMLRSSFERSLAGLNEALSRYDKAIASANSLLATIASTNQPELAATDINTRIDVIKLAAERAGLAGSIGDIRAKLAELPAG